MLRIEDGGSAGASFAILHPLSSIPNSATGPVCGAYHRGMLAQKWLQYALLSALCASLVGIFGKVGMKGIDANLATAFRSVVQALFVLAVCTALGTWTHAGPLHAKAVLSIIAAGVAGGASWLFYFKALQAGTVAQVAPIDKLSMPLAVLLAVI